MQLKFIIPSLLVMMLFSCSPTTIAKIASEKTILTSNGFVFENDTIKITYHFWDVKGRMAFDIYNKLDVPVYIDWKTSAFIPNDKMVSYFQDVTNTEGYYESSSYLFNRSANNSGNSKTKSVRAERVAVIPPQSMITQRDYTLIKKTDGIPANGNFDKSNSPLRFRNYLTISTNEKFEGKVLAVNNSFFVTGVKTVSTSKYQKYKGQDAFYWLSNKF